MPKVSGWKKTGTPKTGYHQWKSVKGQSLWVYPHKTWDLDKEANVKNYRTTKWTVRNFAETKQHTIKHSARTLGGKSFKTQKKAFKYATSYIKRHPIKSKR